MQLSSIVTPGYTVVTATGELDIATAGSLRAYLRDVAATATPAVVFDLSAVDFLDSTTLGVLVGVRKTLADRGGRFDLVCPQAQLLRIFHMTGLDQVFTIYPSLDAVSA